MIKYYLNISMNDSGEWTREAAWKKPGTTIFSVAWKWFDSAESYTVYEQNLFDIDETNSTNSIYSRGF